MCVITLFCYPQDFKLKSGQFDISLIPDIYDCIKYDVQHNRLVQDLETSFILLTD